MRRRQSKMEGREWKLRHRLLSVHGADESIQNIQLGHVWKP